LHCIALGLLFVLFLFFFFLERGGFLRGGEVFLLVCGRCEQKLLHFYAALWKKFVSVFRKFFFFFLGSPGLTMELYPLYMAAAIKVWRRSEAAVKSGRPKPDCSMRLG